MCTTGCRQCTVQNGCHTGLRQSRCMCTTGCFQSVVQNGGHTGLRHILCTSVPNIWKVPWSIFLAGFLGSGSGQIVGHKSLEQIFQAPCLEEKNPWSNRTSLERNRFVPYIGSTQLFSCTGFVFKIVYRALEAPSGAHVPDMSWKKSVTSIFYRTFDLPGVIRTGDP